jgi:hypothetical protein
MSENNSSLENLEANVKSAVDAARELGADLAKLGAGWVRYGLTVGESSVQASARTLDEVAHALRKLADRVRDA